MRILTHLLVGIASLLVAVVTIGLLLPRHIVVERSIEITAPPATVFALIDGFTHFNRFSPWARLDPDMEYTFSGPRNGAGAAMRWQSRNPDVGTGRLEVIESTPYEQVVCLLEFEGMDHAVTTFLLASKQGMTTVNWRFETDTGNDIAKRWFGLLFDVLIGDDYEEGLATLKAIAEDYPPVDIATLDITEVALGGKPLLLARGSAPLDETAMYDATKEAYARLHAVLTANALAVPAEAIIITREWNEAANRWTFDAAHPLPVDSNIDLADSGLVLATSPKGEALRSVLRGADYAASAANYEKIDLFMKLFGYENAGDAWQTYRSDPLTTPREQRVAEIFVPVKPR